MCYLGVLCVLFGCSLGVLCMFVGCSLHVLWMFCECSLCVLWVFFCVLWVFFCVLWVFFGWFICYLRYTNMKEVHQHGHDKYRYIDNVNNVLLKYIVNIILYY